MRNLTDSRKSICGNWCGNSRTAVEERVAILLGMFQAKETWISSGCLGLWLVYVSPTNVIKKLTTNNNNNTEDLIAKGTVAQKCCKTLTLAGSFNNQSESDKC